MAAVAGDRRAPGIPVVRRRVVRARTDELVFVGEDDQLHPVGPTVLGGMVLHPFQQAAEVLRFYRQFAAEQPDELTTYAGILTGPDGHSYAVAVMIG